MAYNAGAIVTNFTAGVKDFKAGIKTTKDELSGLAKSVSKTGTKLKSAGSAMTKYVTAPLIAIGAAAGKFGIEFENEMTKSLSIMGDISNDMRTQMENTAREIALTTDKSAKEAAESYYYLASAGMDAAQAMEALPKVAEFATAGQFDMATATDLLTDAQSALGMASEDTAEHMENMQQISDVLTQAQNMANASTQQFSEALTNEAASSLKATGKSIEEGVALLAVFADQGIKGAKAGNTLARTITYLQDAQNKNGDVWETYNMSIYDAEGNMKSLADIVEMMESKLGDLSDAERAHIMKRLGFNAETQKTLNLIMGTSEQIRQYQADLENAGGATEEIANKQMKSMKKQLGLLIDGLKDAALSIYDMLEPAISNVLMPILQAVVNRIRSVAGWFGSLPEPIQAVIGVFGMIAAALGPVLMAVGTFMTMIGPLIPTITAVGGAIMALGAGPLTLIVAAIIAVIAIFSKWHEEILGFLGFLTKHFIGFFKNLPDMILFYWEGAVKYTKQALEKMKQLISDVLYNIGKIVSKAWDNIKSITSRVWNAVKNTISDVLSAIITLFLNWTPLGQIIKYWDDILAYTKNIWNKVKEFIAEIWTGIIDTISDSALVQAVKEVYQSIKNTVTEVFKTIVESVSNAWNTVTDYVTNSAIWNTAVTLFQNFVSSFISVFTKIPQTINDVWNRVIDFTFEAFKNMAESLKEMFNIVVDWIPDKVGQIVNGIKSFWTDVYDYLSNQDLYSIGRNIIGSLADGVRSAMTKVINSVKDVASGLTDAAKKVLGISSSSKVFANIGTNIGEGLEKGIDSTKTDIKSRLMEIKDEMTAGFNVSSPIVNPAVAGAANVNNSQQSAIYNKKMSNNITFNNTRETSASEERRKQEQLLRKLGAEYDMK